ncbi:muscarinic acetylcholine receptor M2 [Lingula anatina]|uniref:Muscarinic acetylcholine receptor M2 n=1 Tax=Lingula anatina TaxID=7574 RepID=A0A1S3JRI2_LINAN|nr:muscarinic acetylcholine receptor M2 [Lingula anatina]XP_013412587.1 muscarinic acetylcholine receptor M2 [Lingula anatina]XP_013412588.1 muscarinic acetylcholine receptor M2 [Lingula anatina]XP_013412589.1 muscarinic acetylcholine receptor M2 [Lingula anatina]|eukprot:XP_013412586.1 muscarinic acetylcholine receptor M2 [Lingula anatina]
MVLFDVTESSATSITPIGVAVGNGTVEGTGSPFQMDKPMMIVTLVLLGFLSVFGTVGNALILIVYCRKREKLTANLFILALAFIDFITCLFIIPSTIYFEFVEFSVNSDIACKLYQFFTTSTIPLSAFVMVAIAFDRYFCICHPFLRAINLFRAKVIVIVLAIMATMLGVVVAMCYGVYRVETTAVLDSPPRVAPIDAPSLSPMDPRLKPYYTPVVLNSTQFYELTFPPTEALDTVDNETIAQMEALNGSLFIDRIVFNGRCDPDDRIILKSGRLLYQYIHASMFIMSLVIVIVLYALIYRTVVIRRRKRERQKSSYLRKSSMNPPTEPEAEDYETDCVELKASSNENGNAASHGAMATMASINATTNNNEQTTTTALLKPEAAVQALGKKIPKKGSKNRSPKRNRPKDKLYLANIKTAAMLFVVTVVFAVTFLPAALMANEVIDYVGLIFYLYFVNNVANPIIYGFMNQNFRDDLKALFGCA